MREERRGGRKASVSWLSEQDMIREGRERGREREREGERERERGGGGYTHFSFFDEDF